MHSQVLSLSLTSACALVTDILPEEWTCELQAACQSTYKYKYKSRIFLSIIRYDMMIDTV